MIRFLYKGLVRDSSRSFFPLNIITLIYAIIIFFSGFLNGIYNSLFFKELFDGFLEFVIF